jgi:hypothetical protein
MTTRSQSQVDVPMSSSVMPAQIRQTERPDVNPTPINSMPSIPHDVLSLPGQPLDATTRTFMEPRFSQGFSHDWLDLLGVDASTLSPAEHENVDKRVDAFIEGTNEGKKLTQRARWEKIFPFLRRVDVRLHRPQGKQPQAVPECKKETNCDLETSEWAKKNMPPLPPEKRLLPSSGNC